MSFFNIQEGPRHIIETVLWVEDNGQAVPIEEATQTD